MPVRRAAPARPGALVDLTARLPDEPENPRRKPPTNIRTTWDLGALVPGGASAAVPLGEAAVGRAERFADAYRDRVAELDATALAEACAELEAIVGDFLRPSSYAALRFAADSRPPAHGALLSEMQELGSEIEALTTFFDLEWLEVEDACAHALLGEPVLTRFTHHLEELRASGPHRLSEAEERVLDEKALTGVFAWRRLFDEHLASLRPEIDGEELELDEALIRLASPDRDERRGADRAVTTCLAGGLELRARILNIVLTEREVDDRLRDFPHWLDEFNLDNEASTASVRALVQSVVARHDIPRRWMRAKARALGLEQLSAWDEQAPVGSVPGEISWDEARDTVIAAYTGFSSELGSVVERFFADGWIDVEPRRGKQGGAYCLATAPDVHPYVLLNFSGSFDDVLTLAHELGHGAHGILSAGCGALSMTPPLTLAETASVFGETLTFAHLLQRAETPGVRLGMLGKQLDAIVSTVFGQILVHRFEDLIHTERRERGELPVERFGELWLSLRREMFDDAVSIGEGRGVWWSQMASIVQSPGYVYTYAYGQLLALSLYALAREEGPGFAPRFLDLLRAGGSRRPDALLRDLGLELEDPDFWSRGLGIVEDLLIEAESATGAATT